MARAAVKAKQQAAARTQPAKARKRGHAGGGNPNQDLFFMRLRRRQKWVFLVLAIVFAATFVGVGVGSGNGGGLDQLFSGILGGSGASSVSKATAEIKTDPAKGYRDLANAYIQKNDSADAATAIQHYLKIKKKDVGMWSQLGTIQLQQGNAYAQQYQAIQAQNQAQDPAASFQPGGSLGTALGTNPITQYYSSTASTQGQQVYQQALAAYGNALNSYQTAAKIQPKNAALQSEIFNVALDAGKYPTALKAMQRYVTLDPNAPNLSQLEKECTQLGGSCKPPAKSTLRSGTHKSK